MAGVQHVLKNLGLKSIFDGLLTHEKGNELDGIFTSLRPVFNQMIPVEGLGKVTDHKMLTCRLNLEDRVITPKIKTPTQQQLKNVCSTLPIGKHVLQ